MRIYKVTSYHLKLKFYNFSAIYTSKKTAQKSMKNLIDHLKEKDSLIDQSEPLKGTIILSNKYNITLIEDQTQKYISEFELI